MSVLFCWRCPPLLSQCLSTSQWATVWWSSQHALSGKMPAALAWVFVWLLTGFSFYLNTIADWLLSPHNISFSDLELSFILCCCFFPHHFYVFPVSSPPSTHWFVWLFVCPPRWDWHLTMQQRAGNRGLHQSSVKVIDTWLTGQVARMFGGINSMQSKWQ